MTTFAYVARDGSGQRITGKLSAASAQGALAELHARNLAAVKVEPVREGLSLRRRVGVRHLAVAYRQLSDLLVAGVPLLRALRLLGRMRSAPYLASTMSAVADRVADGDRLADAMSAHEGVFAPVHVAMIRAGERGGFLEDVLARLAAYLERQADWRGKVAGSLVYPAVLLGVSLLIVILSLIFFVPRFGTFFEGHAVPLPTRLVLGTSSLLTNHWLASLAVTIVLVAFFWWARRRAPVRRRLAVWQLAVPFLGALVANLSAARFCRMLGTLLENGVPLLGAMQIARGAAGHPLLSDAIGEAVEAVRAGDTLTRPLASSGLLSEDVVEMIAVGESANNLPTVLSSIADTIERRVDRILSMLVRLVEPALLLMMGGVVMFIFLALVLPMMRLSAAGGQ